MISKKVGLQKIMALNRLPNLRRAPLILNSIVLFILVPLAGSCFLRATEVKPLRALLISQGSVSYENMVPMVYLRSTSTPSQIKKELDHLPAGYKVAIRWGLGGDPTTNDLDKLTTASGARVRGLWADWAIVQTGRTISNFFKSLKDLGGQVDYYINDFEKGLSVWDFDIEANLLSIPNSEVFDAIQKTSRFYGEGWPSKLGFSDLVQELTVDRYSKDSYLKWNAKTFYFRTHSSLLRSLIFPATNSFPMIKSCNYGFSMDKFNIPDANAKSNIYFIGSNAGSHQSPVCYGRIDKGLSNVKFNGTTVFGNSGFRSLVLSVNQARTAVLSSPVPILPWIAYSNFNGHPSTAYFHTNSLYVESIFHIGLCNPEAFLYWNPRGYQMDGLMDLSDKVFSKTLFQLNGLIGYSDRYTLIKSLSGWYAPYILSGVVANGKSIWRFTPDVVASENASSTIVSISPLIFQVGGITISMPGGSIHTPSEGTARSGIWVMGPANLVPIIQ